MKRKKNNYGKRMIACFMAALMCICIFPVSASAASKIDLGRTVSLKVIYEDGSRKLSDVKFSLYRVAEVTENAKCRLTGDFKQYEDTVSLKNIDFNITVVNRQKIDSSVDEIKEEELKSENSIKIEVEPFAKAVKKCVY